MKPANVFLCDDGQVKVLDFGMAHACGQRRQAEVRQRTLPEQWEGAPEDERTDVYAMGVLLYRLLAGELPFPDDRGASVQRAGPAPILDVPELPGLGDLVTRMLEKAPVLRPRDGGEVLSALRILQVELERSPASGAIPATTRPRTGFPRLVSELKRRRVVPAMLGYGTFALVASRAVDWLAQTGRVPGWASALSLALDPGYSWAISLLDYVLGDRVAERLDLCRRAVATRRSAANLSNLARAEYAAGADEAAAAAARGSTAAASANRPAARSISVGARTPSISSTGSSSSGRTPIRTCRSSSRRS